jgi:predicted Zn finger-like uncharacterized protein
MPDEKFTRCPSCRTVFRVTAEQLAMRGGQVRCGHCRTLFDGVDHLVALAPPAFDDEDAVVDETDLGPPPSRCAISSRPSRRRRRLPKRSPLQSPRCPSSRWGA